MMTILVEKIDDPSDNLFVFFPEDTKVGVKPIRKCVRCHSYDRYSLSPATNACSLCVNLSTVTTAAEQLL